jgi:hypothetical protein
MGKEKKEGVLDAIRKALKGGGKGQNGHTMPEELLFVPVDGVKVVRFLSDLNDEEALPLQMHDKFKEFMPQPCFKYYGKKCPFDGLGGKYRESTFYGFTVYDYENERKRLFLVRPSGLSAMDDLVEIYEKNGTLKDRDIKIIRVSTGDNKSKYKAREVQGQPTEYTVKNKRNPFSTEKVYAIVRGMITVVKPKAIDPDLEDDDGGGRDNDADSDAD